MRIRSIATLALTALLAVGAGAALPAAADTAPSTDDLTWSLAPGAGPDPERTVVGATREDRANYAYAVDPGDEVSDTLVVANRSTTPLELSVYATDAFTTRDGHLDLLPADGSPSDLGTWITLDLPGDTLSLDAGASAEVPFTLTVPDDATPGDHAGGLVTSMQQTVGDGAVSVDRRLALRVHARVSGDLSPGIEVRDLRLDAATGVNPLATADATVTYTLVNTGDARVVPDESVTVAGPGGSAAQTVSADLGELLPGAEVERTVEVTGVRPFFRATADVRVDGVVVGIGGGGAVADSAETAGWVVPWAALAVVVLVVAGVVVWVVRRPVRPAD